jgi:cytochrome c oxidase subunit 2
LAATLTLCSGLVLGGCGGDQSILAPASKQSHGIAVLWWWMLGVAAVVFFGALAMLALAWLRRGTRGLPFFGTRESVPQAMVIGFGVVVPTLTLVALFGVSDVYLVGQTSPPAARTTAMTIDVIGHQWWWGVRYPATGAVTANEIHIPVDTRVNVVATTDDVIHSLWVPRVNRKIDMIPGYRNRVLFDADRVGVYRGQCSQFCGLQHAHMALKLVVQTPAAFRAWLANMTKPAVAPATAMQRAGQQVFMTSACASCHTIAGTPAQATVGPNLTHLATRTSLAADTIANTPSELAAWIRNPQAIKPGDRMPDLGLSRTEISELVSYLDGLR